MSMLRPGGEDASTKVARALSRRRFLDRSLRGITAGAVGLMTTGTLFQGAARAGGDECPCSSPRGVACENCPPGRKRKKCPTGYARCRSVDGIPTCPGCVYEQAWWVSCTGQGEGGLGYRICIDCYIEGDCESTCGCRSAIICGHCTTPADVKAEMAYAMHDGDE